MARIDIPNGEELERIRLWKMTSGLSEAIDSFRIASHDKSLLTQSQRGSPDAYSCDKPMPHMT